MDRPEVVAAAADPRFSPWPFFVALGVVVTLGLSLTLVHVTLIAVVPVGMLVLELLRRRAGQVVRDTRSRIALAAPLKGTIVPVLASVWLLMAAIWLVLGHPWTLLPRWAVPLVGVGVGIVVMLLMRRAELNRMVAVRELEAREEN